ncbi:sex determining protein [Coprinopsis cinerea okayama7|uniref:Sex determining protein n=1 Tax=Coprinopsis cinerea (strain Okayama-7 / 130 / ATCC MYA-4618 / FGSC 9003) TaxID=240176 RepID=A8N710_COPC7|nr:sex determining protein [Coprinopsis cinerea okayama7\|eukprot:XP_001830616.2 sex determining protein [Coprinopsis cinerea okayama7\
MAKKEKKVSKAGKPKPFQKLPTLPNKPAGHAKDKIQPPKRQVPDPECEEEEEEEEQDKGSDDESDDEGSDDEGSDEEESDEEESDDEGSNDEGSNDEGSDGEGSDEEGSDEEESDEEESDEEDSDQDHVANKHPSKGLIRKPKGKIRIRHVMGLDNSPFYKIVRTRVRSLCERFLNRSKTISFQDPAKLDKVRSLMRQAIPFAWNRYEGTWLEDALIGSFLSNASVRARKEAEELGGLVEEQKEKRAQKAQALASKSGSSKTPTTKGGSSKTPTTTSKSGSSKTPTTKGGSSKTTTTKSGSSKTPTTKSGSSKTTTTKSDSSKTPTTKSGSSKTITTKSDSSKTPTTKSGSSKTTTTKSDSSKTPTTKSGSSKTTTTKSDSSKTPTTKGDSSKTPTTTTKSGSLKTPTTKSGSSKTTTTKFGNTAITTTTTKRKCSSISVATVQEGVVEPPRKKAKHSSEPGTSKKPSTTTKLSSSNSKSSKAKQSAQKNKENIPPASTKRRSQEEEGVEDDPRPLKRTKRLILFSDDEDSVDESDKENIPPVFSALAKVQVQANSRTAKDLEAVAITETEGHSTLPPRSRRYAREHFKRVSNTSSTGNDGDENSGAEDGGNADRNNSTPLSDEDIPSACPSCEVYSELSDKLNGESQREPHGIGAEKQRNMAIDEFNKNGWPVTPDFASMPARVLNHYQSCYDLITGATPLDDHFLYTALERKMGDSTLETLNNKLSPTIQAFARPGYALEALDVMERSSAGGYLIHRSICTDDFYPAIDRTFKKWIRSRGSGASSKAVDRNGGAGDDNVGGNAQGGGAGDDNVKDSEPVMSIFVLKIKIRARPRRNLRPASP